MANGTFSDRALDGKTVLVTGSGSGIGKATATIAAAAGARVIATDIRGQDDTAAAIAEAGGDAEARSLDVTSADAWEETVAEVLGSHTRIDALANVAGIVSDTDDLQTQTEDGWDKIVNTDLKGPWLGMQACIGTMLENGGGKFVNIASTAGLIGMPNVVAYSAAKGGVIAMTRQVAIEYAARGIRANVICPGVTQTSMLGDITEELLAAVSAATPVGVLGDPEDIGGVITFLLSSAGDWITGQVLPVDGGWTAQ